MYELLHTICEKVFYVLVTFKKTFAFLDPAAHKLPPWDGKVKDRTYSFLQPTIQFLDIAKNITQTTAARPIVP